MKSTGIVRRIDNLGRVVLPIELRRTFDINKEDPVEIYVDNEYILLKKYEPACIFCNEAGNVVNYKDKNICRDRRAELKKRAKKRFFFRKTQKTPARSSGAAFLLF